MKHTSRTAFQEIKSRTSNGDTRERIGFNELGMCRGSDNKKNVVLFHEIEGLERRLFYETLRRTGHGHYGSE